MNPNLNNQEFEGYHGGPVRGRDLYFGSRDLAEAYTEDTETEELHEVSYRSENPVRATPEFMERAGVDTSSHQWLRDELMEEPPDTFGDENWHPNQTSRVNALARIEGRDAVVVDEELFDEDYDLYSGTYGDPQVVGLHGIKARTRRIR